MPDWAVAIAVVGAGLAITFGIAWHTTSKQIARTLARRPNPTHEEFRAAMLPDVSETATAFLWEAAVPYLRPRLTPHPDDDLLRDLPIDDEDWSLDWPRDFALSHGFSDNQFPAWPENMPVTIRNFGKWLDLGLAATPS